MIRTLSDLLRHYGDQAVLNIGASHVGGGTRTTITFEIDHPAECLLCEGTKEVPLVDMGYGVLTVPCPLCHGSGLAVEIGGEG